RKKQVRKINEDLLVLMTDGPSKMLSDAATAAQSTLDVMKSRFGYCDNCARDAVLALIRKRYS
ncbi:MAG: serine protein kinase, partial [Myxococcales bacterium]|nr:serine protein kinase [Myxococcales bacterium]